MPLKPFETVRIFGAACARPLALNGPGGISDYGTVDFATTAGFGNGTLGTINIYAGAYFSLWTQDTSCLDASIVDNGYLTFNGTSGWTSFYGSLSGSGDFTYCMTGGAGVKMFESGSGFTGSFIFYPLANLGTVQIDSTTAMGTGGASIELLSGTLDLNGYSPTLIYLNGAWLSSVITNTSTTANSIINLEYQPTVEWVGSLGANVVDGTMAVGINFSNLNPSAGIVEEYIDGNDTYTGPTTIGSGCYFIMYSPTFYSPITNNGLLEFKGGCNDYAGITNNNRLVFSSPTTITVYGVISGTGYINVWSPTVFQAVNTYTGATYIQSTLTLAGNASIADSYYVGISPGDSLIYAESAGFTETEANQQLAGAGTIVDDSSPNSTINYQAIDAAFLASGGSFQNNTGNPSALLF